MTCAPAPCANAAASTALATPVLSQWILVM
jgi:hypothetical protein